MTKKKQVGMPTAKIFGIKEKDFIQLLIDNKFSSDTVYSKRDRGDS